MHPGIGGKQIGHHNIVRRYWVNLAVIPLEILFSEYQQRINEAVMAAPTSSPPEPWFSVGSDWHDRSTMAVGFSRYERYLIFTDLETRWLISTETGQSIHDDTVSNSIPWWNDATLTISGFGPLAGESIRTTGLAGAAAGFHYHTNDGWRIADYRFPNHQPHICLQLPHQTLYSRNPKFVEIGLPSTTVIAYGFTPSGHCLVIVERDQFNVWRRKPA